MTNDSDSGMLATQWADGKPDREAQVASVNNAMDAAIKTIEANLKFNAKLLSLDTIGKLMTLQQHIKAEVYKRAYAKYDRGIK